MWRSLLGVAALACLLGPAAPTRAALVNLPTPTEWAAPAGAPAAPGDPYAVSFPTPAVPVLPEAPVIAEWTRTALPDETFVLTGTRFTARSNELAGSDTTVWLWADTPAGGVLTQALVWTVSEPMLVATVPSNLPSGMYLVWVENQRGPSAPVCLNRTEPQWLGPLGLFAQTSAVKRAFGKNLSRQHGTNSAWVYLRLASGAFTNCAVTNVEPYAVGFVVPRTLTNGLYRVYAHNGHGGAYGWGGPLDLRITNAWTRGTNWTLVVPSGGDDWSNIQNAILGLTAKPRGGTVRLQTGTYRLSRGLIIHTNVSVRGTGMTNTTLEIHWTGSYWPYSHSGVRFYGSHVAIEDLTLKLLEGSNQPPYGIISSEWPGTNQDLLIRNVTWSGEVHTAACNNGVGVERAEVTGCRAFRCLGVGGSDIWVHHNTFFGGQYGGPDVGGASGAGISPGNPARLIVERNVFRTPDWPVGPGGNRNYYQFIPATNLQWMMWCRRLVSAGINWGSMVQSYIAWNTSTNVAVEDNQGEMILLHGGRGAFAEVASNAGTTLTIRTDGLIDGQPLMIYDQTAFTNVPDTVMYGPLDNRAYVLIGGGQGLGQARHIVSHTPTTISVDKSWRVPPAAGSKIAVLYLYRDIVQYRNELNAYPEGYLQSNQTASCGVDYDGNCFGCVAEGNVSRHTHTARNICASGVSQSYWNEMRSETALATSHSADALVCWFNYYAPVEDKFNAIGPFLLGNAFRGGSREVAGPWFDGSSTHLLGAPAQEHADACGRRRLTAGNVFEGTTAWGAIRGVHAGPLTDTLFRKVGLTLTNVTGRVPPYPDTPQPVYQQGGSVALLSGNRYAGAPTNYHGDGMFVPGPLPVPLHRVARFVGQVSQPLPDVIVPFANAGTRAADWSAETPDPRITAQVLDTPLAPEAIGRARVAVDAVTLTRGTHWSQVILSSAATSVVVGVRVELSDPASNAPAGPTAAFAADPTTGLAPLPVQFRNLSSAGSSFVSAWQWDCDADGAPDSGEREPLWQYATAATYSVRLTVRTGLTNSTLTRTNYVTVLARDAVTNRLPYAESFESQPPGSTLVGVQGWAAGDRAAALVATDRTVNAYRGPLPMAAAHQQLLRTQGRLDNRFAGTDGITNVTLDLMARLPRWTNGVPPLDSDDALALFTDGQGRLRLYHGVDAGGGSYSNVLTPLGSDPIGTDEWARLTLTLDYLSGAPRRFGQVQLHGRRAFTDALAFAAPTNLVHPGSWFLCANQGAVPARFGAVEFGGRVAVEDLVVTNGLLNLLNWKVAASASPETAGGIRPSGTFYVAHAGLTNFTLSPSNYWVGTFVVNGLTNAATNTLTLAVTNDLSVAGVFDWLRATNRVPVWWLAGHGWGGNWDDWALRDDDGDGVPSWMEYFADTDPTNRLSLLEMLGIRLTGGVVRLEWQGGTGAWQYVEWAGGLSPTGTSWQALWTNAPPTPRSNVLVRAGVTNPASLYRLRAERP